MSKHSLSITILLSTFFSPYLFSANPLDNQKEGFSTPTYPLAVTPKQITVRDYTILHHKNINHILEDIEEVEEDLESDILTVNAKLATNNNQSPPLLLAAVFQHKQTHEYHQYLIADTGLLSEATQPKAVKRAHKKGFHLIQATRGHVSLQLLEWQEIAKYYIVTALHTNRPVCHNCYLIAYNLWEKKLPTNEKGCAGMTFPPLNKMPNLAQKYINTHLNLSLVQSLVVPMMGYVSKEELNKNKQKNKEIASFIASMQEINNTQISILNKQIKTKNEQIQILINELNNKSQTTETLSNQLKDKETKLSEKSQQLNEKNEQIQILINELNNKSQTTETLSNQLKDKKTKLDEKSQQLNEKNEHLNELKSTLKKKDIKHQQQLKEKDDQLKEEYEKINTLNQKVNKKDKQLKENQQKIAELQSILQNIPTQPLDDNKKKELFEVINNNNVDDVMMFLLTYKDVVKARDKWQVTPFLCAAEKGQLAIAKLLRQLGANIHVTDTDGDNALHLACSSGSVEMVTWLLDVCKIGIETKGFNQRTPFVCAAEKGKLAIAKLLKELGANINGTDKNGNNALHKACLWSGSVDMVTWLLDECKISLGTKGGLYQKTPFLCAVEKGQLAIAKLLKERDANIHATDKGENNALHYACLFSGSVEMVTWLLDECKISLETKGQYQKTPFLFAAKYGQLAIAKLLKNRGANIHAKDNDGNNALHKACYYSDSAAMVTWLLDVCKIDKEAKGGFYQKTPFLCAAEKGKLAIAKLLKNRGANIHAKDNDGNNALHKACYYSDSAAMVTWLLDVCRIGIETKGFNQKTPFLSSVEKGQLATAKLLKKRGANIHATDKYEDNALKLASSQDNEMISYLKSLGLKDDAN